ncbi:aldehyde dehydrogenase family protein [Ornithinimicrobium sp. F0845]|uniref:aldehyde dehydrogenase family protein n=1 Tax=Ornithinimicrobium sp. F0845 TaxID=2926412 RepID=UPI001FF17139
MSRDTPFTVPCFIEGAWQETAEAAERQGPYHRHVVSIASQADAALVEVAVKAAIAGRGSVATLSPSDRADILERAADLTDQRSDEIAERLALELGKPVRDGRGEALRVAATFRIAAAETRRLGGSVLPAEGWPLGRGSTVLTRSTPVGVVLAITPFNAPANLLAHKLAASFAGGNSTIIKSPPQAPASTAIVVEIALEAGVPAEAIQLLHGGADIGAQLCAAPGIGAVAFTGSAAAGAAVARAAGPKRTVLELGGNAATIVHADADVAKAAAACARTGYSNSGQSCISVQRVYVHSSRFDEFVTAFTGHVNNLVVGDPLDPATEVGSMVDDQAASRVASWVEEAVAEGGTVPTGGVRSNATVTPAVVLKPPASAKVVREEIFGPAVVVLGYDDLDQVVEECNASRYGLQAGLFTHDVGTIFDLWRRLEVGALVINGPSNHRLDHIPFGGVKDSGIGRESPAFMIEDFMTTSTLHLRGISLWSESEISSAPNRTERETP